MKQPEETTPGFDALIVLGALIGRDGRPGRVARLRMVHALTLMAEQFPFSPLIVSGGRKPGTPVSEARAMAEYGRDWWAQEKGCLPPRPWEECFIFEETSLTTAESAQCTAQVLLERGWRRAGLITDDLHLRRARYLFRRRFTQTGLQVEALPPLALLEDYLRRRRYLRLGKFLVREAGAWLKVLGRQAAGRR